MTTPTPEELAILLAEARAAYHQLMTGQAVVEIKDQNGESVRFTSARRADLYAYIQELQALLCPAPVGARSHRPMGFIF